MSLVSSLIGPVTGILDKVIEDKDQKAKLAHELATMADKFSHEQQLAQIEVNKAEAASGSLFKGGWRPFIGWVCGIAFCYHFVVQPIIGAISDGTLSSKFGRRKPFFLLGAIVASLALIAMPYSSSIWMAAGLLWILDAGNNIALEPYRAFISDKLPEKQYSFGFLVQSFFTGLGTTLANFTPAILVSFGILALTDKMDNGIPVSTYWAFAIGAAASIITILITVFTTSEYPPTPEELKNIENFKTRYRYRYRYI